MRIDILEKKELILKWIGENKPKTFISRELKCKNYTLDSYLLKMGIEYGGNPGLKGKISTKRVPVAFYLRNGSLIKSHQLKLRLIRDGVKEKKCEECGRIEWNGKDIPLELHHIDGNSFNNELTNLKLLCCNCHAQTSNYSLSKKWQFKKSAKKSKIKIERPKKEKTIYYCSCGKPKSSNRVNMCKDCKVLHDRKVKNRPSMEELLSQISESNYESVARKYGVSSRTIRDWIIKYNTGK